MSRPFKGEILEAVVTMVNKMGFVFTVAAQRQLGRVWIQAKIGLPSPKKKGS